MAEQEKGGGAENPDLLFARNQLANLQAQLPRLEAAAFDGAAEYDAYEQAAKRASQLMQVIAALETEEPAYKPTHSHARSNGLVFAQPEVRPLPTHNRDERPSGAPIQFNHKDGTGPLPVSNTDRRPAGTVRFNHEDPR